MDFVVLRYNTDGSLDGSFGSSGIVTKDLGHDEVGYAIDIQSDGKIVLAGSTTYLLPDCALMRLNQDGTTDETFGSDGCVVIEINTQWDELTAVKIKQDGKIVAGGHSKPYNDDNRDFMILQMNSDGSLDENFNSTGKRDEGI